MTTLLILLALAQDPTGTCEPGATATQSPKLRTWVCEDLGGGPVWRETASGGPSGPSGPMGTGGAAGLTGATGVTGAGVTGATGSQGPFGEPGGDGLTGATGPSGPMGSGGAAGLTGATGAAGVTGATGPAGGGGLTVVILPADVSTTSATVWSTVWSIVPPASKTNTMKVLLAASSSVAGNGVQVRVASADTGNVGRCRFEQPSTATAVVWDALPIGNNTTGTAHSVWPAANVPDVITAWCAFTSDATPGALTLDLKGEIATTTTYKALKGSFYELSSQ